MGVCCCDYFLTSGCCLDIGMFFACIGNDLLRKHEFTDEVCMHSFLAMQ
jgi:hypothetical protein